MRILAFVDTHGNKSMVEKIVKKSKDVDLIVCAGDISNFGANLNRLLLEFKKLNKLLLIIHGNHEDNGSLIKITKNMDFVKVIHGKAYRCGNYVFFGYGGGGFSLEDKTLEKLIPKIKKSLKKDDKLIFITHAPPINTNLDILEWAGHTGCESRRKFIEELKPRLCVCGHLHENVKKKDKIGGTIIINPGESGLILRI